MKLKRLISGLFASGLFVAFLVAASDPENAKQLSEESTNSETSEEPPSFRDEVLKVVQANFAKLRECFAEAADRKDPSIPEKLSTLFRIGKHGNVQSVSFEEAEMMTGELHRCIVARITYFKFPSRDSAESSPASTKVRLVLNFKKPE
jgi:hypothetical protein